VGWDGRGAEDVGKKNFFAVLGVLLAALLMAAVQTDSKASEVSFGSQSLERQFRDAVEIGDDTGGYVAEYALRFYTMKDARQRVRFAGGCDSACTLFLALPAEQTCITENAYFRFHAPSAPSASAVAAVSAYMMRKYPRWVRTWLVSQGGLSDRLATMSYQYAQNFMRTCPTNLTAR
jgi:hypothetical protein